LNREFLSSANDITNNQSASYVNAAVLASVR